MGINQQNNQFIRRWNLCCLTHETNCRNMERKYGSNKTI